MNRGSGQNNKGNGQRSQQNSYGNQQNSYGNQQYSQRNQQNGQGNQQNGYSNQQNGGYNQQNSQGTQQNSNRSQQNSQPNQQNRQGFRLNGNANQQNRQVYYERRNDNNNNYQYRNNTGIQLSEVEENGQYLVDELGQKFLQKYENGQYVKKRIFLHKNNSDRALHEMQVKYRLVEGQQDGNNLKAQIQSVEGNYSEIKPLIGFFSYNEKRPEIDFNIQSKEIRYQGQKILYFFPLQVKYPTMVLEVDESCQPFLNNIFKNYFIVKVKEWPERLLKIGPLVQILEQRGMLYDQESDCQAVLESLNMNTVVSKEEQKCVDKVVSEYQNLFKKNKKLRDYTNLKCFSIDQNGTQAFDDAFTFERISSKQAIDELLLARKKKEKQIKGEELSEDEEEEDDKDKNKKRGNKKQNKKQQQKKKKGGKKEVIYIKKYEEKQQEQATIQEKQQIQEQEEQKQVQEKVEQKQVQEKEEQKQVSEQEEQKQEQTECSKLLYKLGIHIADLSQSIQKDTALYKALETRGQSIYVPLGKDKSFVKHMLDRKLVQLFSLKAGETKQAKSLFICVEKDQNGQFFFLWETLRLEDSVIECKKNYYYNQFDSFITEDRQKITDLFKDDDDEEITSSDDESEDDDIKKEIVNDNKNLILSQDELQNIFYLGGQLFQQRQKMGQKAFSEDEMDKSRFISSKLVEELMIFYNQQISRQIQVNEQIFNGQKDIKVKIDALQQEQQKLKKEIQKSQTQIQAKINKAKKTLSSSQQNKSVLEKNIKGADTQIKNNDKILKECSKKIEANKAKIQTLKDELELINNMDEEEFQKKYLIKKQNNKFAQLNQVINPNQESNFEEKKENEQLNHEDTSNTIDLSQLNQIQFQQIQKQFSEKNQNQQNEESKDNEESEDDESSEESEENEESLKSENDSQSLHSLNEEQMNESDNIFTAQKRRLTKQIDNLLNQQKLIQEELKTLSENKVSKKHEQAKQSLLHSLDYFKDACQLAGFKQMNLDSLQAFQQSFDKLKDAKINYIIKKYLFFEKRKVVKQLNSYFQLIEEDKKQEKLNEQKIQQKKEKIDNITKDIEAIKKKFAQAEKNEEQQKIKDLEKKEQKEISVQEVQEENFTNFDEETRSQISVEDSEQSVTDQNVSNLKNIIQQKQKKIKQIEQQIKQKEKEVLNYENQINTNDKKLETLNNNLAKYKKQLEEIVLSIVKQHNEVNDLKKQMDGLEEEIKANNKKIQDEEKSLNEQLEKQVNETYKHFDMTPESEKYLSLSSPIRKFNDIQAQQFIDQNFYKQITQQFSQEYAKIIKSKLQINKVKNQVGRFLEKAQKIKNCRKMILQAQQKQNIDNTYEILQINCRPLSRFMVYDFFLPKQLQIVKLNSDKNRLQNQQKFSIWLGKIQAKLSLPYDYIVTEASFNNIRIVNIED